MKNSIFAEPIQKLPKADIPLKGINAYLSQGNDQQIIFMEFDEDVILDEHKHEAQIGFVLEGKIDIMIDGKKKTYKKGDRYYIPKDTLHSGFIYKGYGDITYFDQKDRYGEI